MLPPNRGGPGGGCGGPLQHGRPGSDCLRPGKGQMSEAWDRYVAFAVNIEWARKREKMPWVSACVLLNLELLSLFLWLNTILL